MISVLLNSSSEKELKYITDFAHYLAAKTSDESWDYHVFRSMKEIFGFLESCPILDIACVDVTLKGGVEGAVRIRTLNDNTSILIIADQNISPMEYIRPDIMASSLLLRPFDGKQAQSVIRKAVLAYVKKFSDSSSNEDVFVVDNREGRQLIPYDRISFFEARDKKIVAVTDSVEYSFYDTIDNLESELPKQFKRSHRSFIVNCDKIVKIVKSQNTVFLEDGEEIPLSRSYKPEFKELKF